MSRQEETWKALELAQAELLKAGRATDEANDIAIDADRSAQSARTDLQDWRKVTAAKLAEVRGLEAKLGFGAAPS